MHTLLNTGHSTRISSTGLDSKSPLCGYDHDGVTACKYDSVTKQECAETLCRAQGYKEATFVSSSNNLCLRRPYPIFNVWVYWLKMSSDYSAGKITKLQSTYMSAKITADCSIGTSTVH